MYYFRDEVEVAWIWSLGRFISDIKFYCLNFRRHFLVFRLDNKLFEWKKFPRVLVYLDTSKCFSIKKNKLRNHQCFGAPALHHYLFLKLRQKITTNTFSILHLLWIPLPYSSAHTFWLWMVHSTRKSTKARVLIATRDFDVLNYT